MRRSVLRSRPLAIGVAAFFVVAAAFHLAALFVPGIGSDVSPTRHAIFVAINFACAFGFARRTPPPYFVAAFVVLVVQQLVSHGGDLVREWLDRGRVDVTSLVIVVAMPALALVAYFRSRSSSS